MADWEPEINKAGVVDAIPRFDETMQIHWRLARTPAASAQ